MAWDYRAEVRRRDYESRSARRISLVELNPVARHSADDYEEWLLKTRVQQVGLCAFYAADAHDLVTMPGIQRRHIQETTANELKRPKRGLRYVVALQGEDALLASRGAQNTEAVAAYARVEMWSTRRGLGKVFGQKFPMLSEFNTADGHLAGRFKPVAAATLHYSVIESEMEAPVGLQIAEADREGVAYFENHGFEANGIMPAASGYGMNVHMITAPGVDRLDVQRSLEAEFPFLAANTAPPFNA